MSLERAVRELTPPYYLVDLDHLRGRHAEIREAFDAHFEQVVVGYSYKTNPLPCVLRTLHADGAWAEVVSDFEYALARRFDVPGARIIFNGPIKSDAAIGRALDLGSILHLDSLIEVQRTVAVLERLGLEGARIGLRVNVEHPEGEGHRRRSRFGLPLEDVDRASRLLTEAGSPVLGLHAHLATRARSLAHFEGLALALGEAAKLVGIAGLEWIDVGGGFGHAPPGFDGRTYPGFEAYAACIERALSAADPALGHKRLIIEPGMALVNDAVRYVAPVEAVKQLGGRRVAFLDASIHTIKPTRHGMNLPARVFDAEGRPKTGEETSWDLVGYTCMDDDYIAVDQPLPPLERGDRVEIANVGAYTLVFKPPFIRAMPPVYRLEGDRIELDLREQSVDELFGLDRMGGST